MQIQLIESFELSGREQLMLQNDRLAREIPSCKYVKLKSINHYIQYVRPNEVVKALDELSENN